MILQLTTIGPRGGYGTIAGRRHLQLTNIIGTVPIGVDNFHPLSRTVIATNNIDIGRVGTGAVTSHLISNLCFTNRILSISTCANNFGLRVTFSANVTTNSRLWRLEESSAVSITVTVSNPTKTNGDAVTHQITQRLALVCISAKTLCHSVNCCIARGNVTLRSTSNVITTLSKLSISVSCIKSRRQIFIGNRSIDSCVHAPTVSVTTSGMSTVPTIHTFLLSIRQGVTTAHSIVVSNQSVNAAVLPGTSIGVFLATSPRTQTAHHFGRLRRGNSPTACRRILTSVIGQSCRSARQRVSPLHRTRSTILISANSLSLRRSVTTIGGIVASQLGLTWKTIVVPIVLTRATNFYFNISQTIGQIGRLLTTNRGMYALKPVVRGPRIIGRLTSTNIAVTGRPTRAPRKTILIVHSRNVTTRILSAVQRLKLHCDSTAYPFITGVRHVMTRRSTTNTAMLVTKTRGRPRMLKVYNRYRNPCRIFTARRRFGGYLGRGPGLTGASYVVITRAAFRQKV